jgi:hypothetical protein
MPIVNAVAPAAFDTARRALAERLRAVVSALVEHATERQILDAIAAPSGGGAIAQLVSALPEEPAVTADPLAAAYARAADWRDAYAATTPLFTAGEALQVLNLKSTEALRKRDRAGTIVALPLATGKFMYPAWQFVDGRVVAGIAAVRSALETPNGWAFAGQLDSIRSSEESPGRTLRELLIAGESAAAVHAARAATESGGA